MLVVQHPGIKQKGARGFRVPFGLRQFGVFRVQRADMVVLRRFPAPGEAELQNLRVIHRQGQRAAHPRIGIRAHAVHLRLLMRADYDGRGGHRIGAVQPQTIKHFHKIAGGKIVHVHLFGIKRGDHRRRVRAVVQILNPVQIRAVAFVPPFVVFAPFQHVFDPDVVFAHTIRAGAERGLIRRRVVVILMHHRSRVFHHPVDERDVRIARIQAHSVLIHHLNRACGGQARIGVNQGVHAPGHGVALNRFVAPAGDVVGHILGGKVIAVMPFHALAHIQRVLGGVFVDFPALQQLGLQSAMPGVTRHIFQHTASRVAHLRP